MALLVSYLPLVASLLLLNASVYPSFSNAALSSPSHRATTQVSTVLWQGDALSERHSAGHARFTDRHHHNPRHLRFHLFALIGKKKSLLHDKNVCITRPAVLYLQSRMSDMFCADMVSRTKLSKAFLFYRSLQMDSRYKENMGLCFMCTCFFAQFVESTYCLSNQTDKRSSV